MGVIGLIFLSVHRRTDPVHTPLEMAGWSPTPPTIQKDVKAARLKYAINDSADIRARFILDFQERYRSNGLAVAVRFGPKGKVRLLCGATLARWQMARIAITLHDELQSLFGHSGDIDIYVTYIVKQVQHIGVARELTPGKPLSINFDREIREEQRYNF